MAQQTKDSKSPATTSAAYDQMAPRWHLIETLLGGTEAMRAAGETYLPRHSEETDKGYEERLNSAVLLNMVSQTLDTLSGKPFTEEVKLNDDVPEMIEDQVLEDVDLQGNNLNVFARRWFREGMAKAFAHVLIDFPRPAPREDGQPRTLADDRAEGLRPYWVMIKPECLLFARSDIINGVEVLQHVRIMESYTVQDGFAEVERRRIRVLEPGLIQLWEPQTKGQKEEWVKTDEWGTGLNYIPLVTFYADRDGFMTGKPPLMDLAHLNVAHWQSTSDQRHILTVTRFPLLACSGASGEDGDPVVIGPNKVLYNPDPQGRFYYVEHTGSAIKAGRDDLHDLETQMAGYGAEFLKKRPGGTTATARALDSAEASSDLSAMVGLFEDAVAQALSITAEWMRLGTEGGSIELVKDFTIEEKDPAGLNALQAARDKRDISRKAYLNALRLRNVLPEDFDPDEDWEELMEEMSDAMGAAGLDLNPGDPTGGTRPPLDNPDGINEEDLPEYKRLQAEKDRLKKMEETDELKEELANVQAQIDAMTARRRAAGGA